MVEQSVAGPHAHRRALLRHEDKATVTCEAIEVETGGAPEFHDITDDVVEIVKDSGVTFGQVTIFSSHTTAAIRINENEPLLLRDMARILRQIAPSDAYYEHNDFGRRTVNMNPDECANGHAHCQHLFLASSETIPVIDGRPALGAYQRIFLIELDHPRMRQVLVTVIGC
jgi:secondary thiamine-phosphate synthase enzyme